MNEKELAVPIRVLHDITARFESLRISYMLTGSMALFHYAIYRMTADIDIVVELTPRHSQLLIDSLEPEYYIPHTSMRRAIDNERMFNVLHQDTAFRSIAFCANLHHFRKWRSSAALRPIFSVGMFR